MHGPSKVEHGFGEGFRKVSGGGSWPEAPFFYWKCPRRRYNSLCSFHKQPNELKWKKLEQKGEELPKPRSGHSLTYVGQNRYLMYGGIEDNPNNKIVPNAEVWQL